MTAKILIAAALMAGCLNADIMFSTTAGSQVMSLNVDATADFFLTGSSCGATGGCTLWVAINNLQTNEAITQAVSGVTFTLSNVTTTLWDAGILALGSDMNLDSANELGGGTLTGNGKWANQTNTKPGSATGDWGSGSLALTVLGGSKPVDLITDAGQSPSGSGFSAHGPSLLGPIYFQITGVTDLTTATTISDVTFLFGTTPDGSAASNCTSSTDGGNCTLGNFGGTPTVPEPLSFFLAGTGLIALASMRRRFVSAK